MKTLWRLVFMYFPVAFLAVLALLSFWLSPSAEDGKRPVFTAALEQAHYLRLDGNSALQMRAMRMEQTSVGHVKLHQPQLKQMTNDSQLVLHGDSGHALHGDSRLSVFFDQVSGIIEQPSGNITLHADVVSYDADSGVLAGKQPIFQGQLGQLSGDSFQWDVADGVKIQGRVESIYYR
ncbi:hypothetical protein NQX30_03660 [Candidatus Persebacteraceae bacterium Df01]|uniref:LPS export ABC transporter periplasmic protein LptC n=1 Tax=Candidatus Doriopsillibacter californiensis TaxID=2970740 RepID=A0ABT7QL92_9GAMM|nr:hypothetical protein [Candidatus Persebacteraceae bacterium Df01]